MKGILVRSDKHDVVIELDTGETSAVVSNPVALNFDDCVSMVVLCNNGHAWPMYSTVEADTIYTIYTMRNLVTLHSQR